MRLRVESEGLMVVGSCPYDDCDKPLLVQVGDHAGLVLKHTCEYCNRTIWTYLSRIDPWSMTDKNFKEEHPDARRN